MERRDFLTGASSLLAVGVAPPVGQRDVTGLGEDPTDEAIEGWLVHVDRELETISHKPVSEGTKRFLRQRGVEQGLLDEVRRSTAFTAALHGIAAPLRDKPAIRRAIEHEAPRGARALFQIADMLETVTDKDLTRVATALADDPQLMDKVRDTMFAHCQGSGVPKEHLELGARALDDAAWKLQHQSSKATITQELAALDKACRSHGFARKEWRKHVSSMEAGPKGKRSIGPQTPGPAPPTGQTKQGDEAWRKSMRIGGTLLGISAGAGILGALFLAIYEPFALIACVGCVLIPLGLIFLLIGGILYAVNPGDGRPSEPEDLGEDPKEDF